MLREGTDPIPVLDKTIRDFADGIRALDFQRSLTLAEFKRSHVALSEQLDARLDQNSHVRGHATRIYLVDLAKEDTCINPASNKIPEFILGSENADDEHLKRWLEDGLNQNLRWSMVSAFELHERFLKDLYAVVGYLVPFAVEGFRASVHNHMQC